MIQENGDDFSDTLRQRISKARRIAVVGIGDDLSPVDRLGMVAAREIEKMHLPGMKVFLAGTVPENITGIIRKCKPDHVVFIDSADMGLLPGSIMMLKPEETQVSLVASHVIPLSVVLDFVRHDTGAGVTLLGIQPDLTRVNKVLSPSDQARLSRNLTVLLDTLREICCRQNGRGK
ncbi:MAG TPA: hydrogenase maturation protease [Methanoregulaceae archaeon]|nr:hydrogenase maturation protease [Methanoregulaceae archaeon]